MNKTLKIYSNIASSKFFEQFFPKYRVEIISLDNLDLSEKNKNGGVVIYFESPRHKKFLFKNISNDYLFLSNIRTTKDNQIQNNKPIHVETFKNKTKNFLNDRKVNFKSLYIKENKLVNRDNSKFCFLTDIENEILRSLFILKKCSKENIKKSILKLKSNIETNSLESHLTRIRKKFDKIQTSFIIQSKHDNLIISINQKSSD